MTIESYHPRYKDSFYQLNVEWLETFFYVEPYDREVLNHPQKYIIDPGGHIFFALENDSVVGCVALLHRGARNFELTKMAVLPTARGRKIGQKLMQFCIDFAQENRFERLFLYSHTKLENAIYIYRKFGFKEVALEQPNPYKRSNIKMVFSGL